MFERRTRVSQVIQREVSRIIHEEIKDDRISFVTIMHVDISENMKTARIYISILQEDSKKILKALKKATSFIRFQLSQKLISRRCPELFFVLDKSAQNTENVNTILKKVIPSPQTPTFDEEKRKIDPQ